MLFKLGFVIFCVICGNAYRYRTMEVMVYTPPDILLNRLDIVILESLHSFVLGAMSTDFESSHLPSKQDVPVTIASVDIDPRAERALVWKFDLRLLPVLAIMYLFNSLDKSNLGNAKTAGLEGTPSLGLITDEYHIDMNDNDRNTLPQGQSI